MRSCKPTLCGVYTITIPASGSYKGAVYVGMSKDIKRRWSHHRGALRRGKHPNHRLQLAYASGAAMCYNINALLPHDQLAKAERDLWLSLVYEGLELLNLTPPSPNLMAPTPQKLNTHQITNVSEMYDLWLSGLTLRAIGSRYGFSQVAVYKAICRKYGQGATSVQRTSMLRSIIADYGTVTPDLRAKLGTIEGTYYSKRTMDGYTKNWGELIPNYNYGDSEDYAEDYREPLRWCYLRVCVDCTVAMLRHYVHLAQEPQGVC